MEVLKNFDGRLARLYSELIGGGVFWLEPGMYGGLNRVDCLVVEPLRRAVTVIVSNYGKESARGTINIVGGRYEFWTQSPAFTVGLLLEMWGDRQR